MTAGEARLPRMEIGAALRRAREAQGSSVEEIAWRLRIRPDAIRALEEDRFDEIGHSAFARTHLRSYAKELGLDASDLVRRYRRMHEVESSPIAALDEAAKQSRKHIPRTRWLLAASVAIVLLLVGSVAGLIHGPGSAALSSQAALPLGPRIVFEPASRSLSEALTNKVTLRIAAVRATEVTVVVDGHRSFAGTLAPGASRLFSADTSIQLDVAEAAALQIWSNGARVNPPVAQYWHASFSHAGMDR